MKIQLGGGQGARGKGTAESQACPAPTELLSLLYLFSRAGTCLSPGKEVAPSPAGLKNYSFTQHLLKILTWNLERVPAKDGASQVAQW